MATVDGLTATAEAGPDDRRASTRAWFVTAMLVVLMLINWADKSVLGLAAVPISREFGLTNTAYGFISSSFFFLFSASSLLVGMLALKVRARWILLILAIGWSVCQVPILAGMGVAGLLASRIALGAFEGPTSSMTVHVAHDWFPPRRRGLPTAFTQLGGALGLAVAAPTLTFLITGFGWRSAFLALALVGLVWALVWVCTWREGPYASRTLRSPAPREAADAPPEPSVWRILVRPTWWGGFVVAFAAYWALALITAWLPAYLQRDLGYTAGAAAGLLTVPPLVGVVSQLGFTLLSDRLLRRGVAPRRSRGLLLGAISLVCGVCVIFFPFAGSSWLLIVLLAVGLGAPAVAFPLCQLVAAEISPVRKRSAVLGWSVGLVTTAGLIAPAVTGVLIDAAPDPHDGFVLTWLVTGALLVVGAVVSVLTIDPVRDARRLGVRPIA